MRLMRSMKMKRTIKRFIIADANKHMYWACDTDMPVFSNTSSDAIVMTEEKAKKDYRNFDWLFLGMRVDGFDFQIMPIDITFELNKK